jgi:hypothetical protein
MVLSKGSEPFSGMSAPLVAPRKRRRGQQWQRDNRDRGETGCRTAGDGSWRIAAFAQRDVKRQHATQTLLEVASNGAQRS